MGETISKLMEPQWALRWQLPLQISLCPPLRQKLSTKAKQNHSDVFKIRQRRVVQLVNFCRFLSLIFSYFILSYVIFLSIIFFHICIFFLTRSPTRSPTRNPTQSRTRTRTRTRCPTRRFGIPKEHVDGHRTLRKSQDSSKTVEIL